MKPNLTNLPTYEKIQEWSDTFLLFVYKLIFIAHFTFKYEHENEQSEWDDYVENVKEEFKFRKLNIDEFYDED